MSRYDDSPSLLGYLFRFLFILIFLGGLGFIGFAYFGDLSTPATPRTVPVTLDPES